MSRYDERDIMFARMGYIDGSEQYKDYYKRNPDKKAGDDELREMEDLTSPKSPTYDEMIVPAVDANFMFLSKLRQFCDGQPAQDKTETESVEISRIIKNMTLHYGAVAVGITKAKDDFFYSHRGRHPENYGEKVINKHKYAIVFAVSMKPEFINTSPQMHACLESSKCYVDGAIIGMQIAGYINNLGYEARNHMDGNYLLDARYVAVLAGIAQYGRNSLVMTDEYGCFVRLGVVTTDLELIEDKPKEYSIADFCRKCGRCAVTCPAKTISKSDDPKDWKIEQEKCYKIWRSLGTDCGICISSCPVGQAVTISEISKMTLDEMDEFLSEYKKKVGFRDYNRLSPL